MGRKSRDCDSDERERERMRIADGKVYASPKVARFWRPTLQPIVDSIGGFLEHRGASAVVVALLLWVVSR